MKLENRIRFFTHHYTARDQMKENPGNKLAELAQFENFFHKDNLTLGFSIWLKSTALWYLLIIMAGAIGILSLLGGLAFLAVLALHFYLLQWASSAEARKRYGIPVLGSCWWSIFWRLSLYMLPVIFALSLMMPEEFRDLTMEKIASNPGPFVAMEVIYRLLSIIPMGLSASKAFLVSHIRIQMFSDFQAGYHQNDGKTQDEENE